MTKKHFEAMAELIRNIAGMTERRRQAEIIAVHCAKANPRFNRDRFMVACRVEVRS
jgi:hypothetical protein